MIIKATGGHTPRLSVLLFDYPYGHLFSFESVFCGGRSLRWARKFEPGSERFSGDIVSVRFDRGPQTRGRLDKQLDPVRDFTMHVDFLRVSKDTEVTVDVPVHFINEEKSGIKIGGVLNIVRHTVEFHCPADAIPEFITVDLSGHKIGGSIHISHVTLPKGVKPVITDRDFTIATIVAPAAGVTEEPEAEEAPASE